MKHHFAVIAKRKMRSDSRRRRWVVNKVRARQGDTITWRARGTAATIWFAPGRDPLGIGMKRIKKGGTLTKTARRAPKKREVYQYSVFCHADNEMAEGGTSPTMIIE